MPKVILKYSKNVNTANQIIKNKKELYIATIKERIKCLR